ncbi:MAG: hypothetical protein C0432_02115 [Candidatus Puniceispirillum sp.]|nr:hypothetical protein [Candidatus Pelagibacter sp.]MBA4283070.1 hypothetical protein [Candidatus Puniceispirillum sp.]
MTKNIDRSLACTQIKILVERHFNNAECIVRDVSEAHAHHQSKRSLIRDTDTPTHIQITVKTTASINKSRVERDREIYILLDPFFQKGLHSAEIKFI